MEVMISLILGLIIVIVLLVIAAAGLVLGLLLWTAICTATVRLVRPEGKRALWLTVLIPLFIPCYLSAIGLLVWWAWPDRNDAYRTTFGVAPSQTVVAHQGEISGFADSVEIELHFTAAQADIQSLTSSGYTLVTINPKNLPPDFPAYPSAAPTQGVDVYVGPSPFPEFEQEGILIYDPGSNLAWYRFEGVH